MFLQLVAYPRIKNAEPKRSVRTGKRADPRRHDCRSAAVDFLGARDLGVKIFVGLAMLLPYGALMSDIRPMPALKASA